MPAGTLTPGPGGGTLKWGEAPPPRPPGHGPMTPRTAGLTAPFPPPPPPPPGQDDPPKAGKRAPIPSGFRAYVVLDDRYPHHGPADAKPDTLKPDQRDPKDRTDKMHDLVGENGLSPVVAV